MFFRKVLVMSLIFVLLSIPVSAKKRRPPLPLEELQNPRGPSYVPIPYPQTDAEIITDLRYAVERVMRPKRKGLFGISTTNRDRILLRYLEKDPDMVVSRIIKVKNNIAAFPRDYAILVELSSRVEGPLARIGFDSTGIYMESVFTSYRHNFKLKPLKNEEEIHKILAQYNHPSLEKSNIIKTQAVFLYSGISRLTSPTWEIRGHDGKIFYIDHKDRVYRIARKVDISGRKAAKDLFMLGLQRKSDTEVVAIDSINDEAIFLEKLEPGKEE